MSDDAYAAALVVLFAAIFPLLSTAEYWFVVRVLKGSKPTLLDLLSITLIFSVLGTLTVWMVLTRPDAWVLALWSLEIGILLLLFRKRFPSAWGRTWSALGLFVLISASVGIGLAWFVLRPTFAEALKFPTANMEPAIRAGDRCIADHTATPRRWDIVTYLSPWDRQSTVVSRLVGMPGETIELRDGEIFIDGAILSRPAHLRALDYESGAPFGNGTRGRAVMLRDDECFVLGDNTGNSRDSRWYPEVPGHTRGAVPVAHLYAVVRYRYSPRERVGFVR